MWRWVCLWLAMPGIGLAQEWHSLDGPAITAALTARVLQYEGGAQQNFFADGRTLYEAPAVSWGHWAVRGDQYCSVWPPSDHWACYGIEARGLDIRFSDGAVGRYVDLN